MHLVSSNKWLQIADLSVKWKLQPPALKVWKRYAWNFTFCAIGSDKPCKTKCWILEIPGRYFDALQKISYLEQGKSDEMDSPTPAPRNHINLHFKRGKNKKRIQSFNPFLFFVCLSINESKAPPWNDSRGQKFLSKPGFCLWPIHGK